MAFCLGFCAVDPRSSRRVKSRRSGKTSEEEEEQKKATPWVSIIWASGREEESLRQKPLACKQKPWLVQISARRQLSFRGGKITEKGNDGMREQKANIQFRIELLVFKFLIKEVGYSKSQN